MNTLGPRIRSIRIQKGFTQNELAKGICTPSMISQIESDRANPSHAILFAVADRLEVSLETLLVDVEFNLEEKSKFALAKALVQAGKYDLALPHLVSLLDSNIVTVSTADLLHQTAICHMQMSNYDQARILLDRLKELAVLRGDVHWNIEVLLILGDLYSRQASYLLAIHHTEQAVEQYKKLPQESPLLYSRILLQLATFQRRIGFFNEATAHLRQAIAIFEQIGDMEQTAQLYLHLAQSHQAKGDLARSQQYAAHASSLFAQVGDQEAQVGAQIEWLLLTCERECWKSNVAQVAGFAGEYAQKGKLEQAGRVYASLSEVCLRLDEVDAAEYYAELGMKWLPADHPSSGVVHRTLADVFFRRENQGGGEEHLRSAIAIFEKNGMTAQLEEATRCLTEQLRGTGRYQAAFEHLEKFHGYVMKQMDERGMML